MNVLQKLEELNIKLPAAPNPVGAYVAYKIIGKILFISGQLPIDQDGKMIKGKIGKTLNLEDGQKLNLLWFKSDGKQKINQTFSFQIVKAKVTNLEWE